MELESLRYEFQVSKKFNKKLSEEKEKLTDQFIKMKEELEKNKKINETNQVSKKNKKITLKFFLIKIIFLNS